MRVFWIWLCLCFIVVMAFYTGYNWSPDHKRPATVVAAAASPAVDQSQSDDQICTPAGSRATRSSLGKRVTSAMRPHEGMSAANIVLPVLAEDSPRPEYPPSAVTRHEEGQVHMKVFVGEDGHVREAHILDSSGKDSLDKAALTSVMRDWHYVPGTRNGAPAPMWRDVKITFTCSADDGRDNCDPNGTARRKSPYDRVSSR